MARQRVPKPSAALPRAAGRLPEDCHKLLAGRALPALPVWSVEPVELIIKNIVAR